MLARVIANFNVRVANVIQQRGAWIEHILTYYNLPEKDLDKVIEIWLYQLPIYYKQIGKTVWR